MHVVVGYAVYLAISIAATLFVARSLHRNGRVFLLDAFQGNAVMADSINHLLVVGFYLINAGFVTYVLRTPENIETIRQSIEMVSQKLGFALLVLGLMHFLNLFIFTRVKNNFREAPDGPPIPSDGVVPPPFQREAL